MNSRANAGLLLFGMLLLPALFLGQGKQAPAKKNQGSGTLETLFRQAEEAIDKEDFAAAVPLLEKFIADRPDEPFAQFQLGYALSRLERYDQAAARYRKVIELDPKFAEAYQNLGLVLIRSGQHDAAIAPLRKAVELRPQLPQPRLLLGEALERTDESQAALEQYREAASLAPNHLEARVAQGRLLLQMNQPAAAEAQFREALTLDPDSARLYQALAESLIAQDKNAAAIPALEKYFALEKDARPEERLRFASLLFQTQEYEKSLAVLDALEKDAAPNAAAMRLRADIFVLQKRYAEAAEVMTKLMEGDPAEATPEMHARLGRLRLEMREFPAAQKHLVTALRAKPELTEALRDLIGVYYVGENWTGALRLLDELAKRETLGAGSWFIRAVCYDKLHMQAEALQAYQQFVALDQGHTERQDFQARQRIKALTRALERKR